MKKSLLKAATGILDLVDKTINWLSIVAMSFMLFLTFANVIGRYVFSHSIIFSEEVSRILFVWVVFLGAAIIIKDNGHVSVDLLSSKLKGKASGKVLDIIIGIAGFLFIGIVFAGGLVLAGTMNMYSSATLGIPMGYVYWAIPIGSGIMFIHHSLNFIKIFVPDEEGDEA
jgi:TRAP-type C4-dicarboxylate transport system permease small subunit